MKQGYRIISIEAADIYRHEQENGVSVGYKMPESKSDAYFRLFKIYLDNSLDLIELEKVYKRVCRKKFSFQDKSENEYTLAVINLKFNYTYKSENGNKMLVVSTASPYKFANSVLSAVSDKKGESEFDTVRLLSDETKTEIPAPIKALENATVRFKEICEKEDMLEAVYNALGI